MHGTMNIKFKDLHMFMLWCHDLFSARYTRDWRNTWVSRSM